MKNEKEVVFTTESGSEYTRADFMNIVLGDEVLSDYLLDLCVEERCSDPETKFESLIRDGDLVYCTECGKLKKREEECVCRKKHLEKLVS